jgi:tRNA(Ile)-lysidine synthase
MRTMCVRTHATTYPASTRLTASIERRVLNYIRKNHIVKPGERVVVGVSGGPDSTALLIILSRLAPKLKLDITVAHFNHRLRSDVETAADLDFVRALSSSLGLPHTHSSGDVRAYGTEHHLSREDAARRLRYAFLSAQSSTVGACVVAVGHTLDDQAETVLLHLIRGTGLAGISGMRPRAPWPINHGPELARPLLLLQREETERYCREADVTPRGDPTNDLLTAARNRVRHEVMPTLRRLNPRIEQALARFADAAGADVEFLNETATQAFTALATFHGSNVTLPRHELAALPRALASRVLRLAFAQAHGGAADLEAAHIEVVLEALHGPPGSHSLPGGITATIDQTSVIIGKRSMPSAFPIKPVALSIPGRAIIERQEIEARVEPPPAMPSTGNRLEAYLDADKTGADLTVRSRRPGDRLRPLGLGGEKKLQDILVDAKVPARDRDAVPLVCSGDQIAWVVGHCIDERYALDPTSRRAIHISASVSR